MKNNNKNIERNPFASAKEPRQVGAGGRASAKEKNDYKRSSKTEADYKKLAENFYRTRLDGQQPSPKRIADALKKSAVDYTPGYWRRLRNALAFDQKSKGYNDAALRIESTNNPVTNPANDTEKERYKDKKPKQGRAKVKSVKPKELAKIRELAGEDTELRAALNLANILGCRPSEMLSIRRGDSDMSIHITGSKKRSDRGIDRELLFTDEKAVISLMRSAQVLRDAEARQPGIIRRIQGRLDTACRRAWPRRKARPTLYSFRHQMGSNLKKSGMSRVEIAYCMGHQSTKSVEVYGSRRSSNGGKVWVSPGVDADVIKQVVRENHKPPLSQQKPVPKPEPGQRPGFGGESLEF